MDNKKLEVVSGDGSNLDISPVREHLTAGKPNTKKPKNIVVPKENSKDKDSKSDKNSSDKEQ